jgi:hypothetical protein
MGMISSKIGSVRLLIALMLSLALGYSIATNISFGQNMQVFSVILTKAELPYPQTNVRSEASSNATSDPEGFFVTGTEEETAQMTAHEMTSATTSRIVEEDFSSPPVNLHRNYTFAISGVSLTEDQIAPSTFSLFEMVYKYNSRKGE